MKIANATGAQIVIQSALLKFLIPMIQGSSLHMSISLHTYSVSIKLIAIKYIQAVNAVITNDRCSALFKPLREKPISSRETAITKDGNSTKAVWHLFKYVCDKPGAIMPSTIAVYRSFIQPILYLHYKRCPGDTLWFHQVAMVWPLLNAGSTVEFMNPTTHLAVCAPAHTEAESVVVCYPEVVDHQVK